MGRRRARRRCTAAAADAALIREVRRWVTGGHRWLEFADTADDLCSSGGRYLPQHEKWVGRKTVAAAKQLCSYPSSSHGYCTSSTHHESACKRVLTVADTPLYIGVHPPGPTPAQLVANRPTSSLY